MKTQKLIAGTIFTALFIAAVLTSRADGTNSVAAPKPDLMTTCPVSGEKLGEMGKPYSFVYQGQEVKLCCPMCKTKFDDNPAPYLKKIQDAANAKN